MIIRLFAKLFPLLFFVLATLFTIGIVLIIFGLYMA